MSREYVWTYEFEGTEADWDHYFETCDSHGFPHRHCCGGSGDRNENRWFIWISANRAKARRIKRLLDVHFGQSGTMDKVTP